MDWALFMEEPLGVWAKRLIGGTLAILISAQKKCHCWEPEHGVDKSHVAWKLPCGYLRNSAPPKMPYIYLLSPEKRQVSQSSNQGARMLANPICSKGTKPDITLRYYLLPSPIQQILTGAGHLIQRGENSPWKESAMPSKTPDPLKDP